MICTTLPFELIVRFSQIVEWPCFVPGDKVDNHMKDKEVDAYSSLTGRLHEVPYDIFVMHEPDYLLKRKPVYASLSVPEN